jgi:hypothetical protein
VVGLSFGLMALLPKTYEVRTILQAQAVMAIPAMGSRAGVEIDPPTKQALETVLRRDNLLALIRQTDLVAEWPATRAPLVRARDAISDRLFGPPTEQERTEALTRFLAGAMWVRTREGIVDIGIHFPDARLAVRLVETAVENFVEARHSFEVSSIADAISLLESRTAQTRELLEEARRTLEALRRQRAQRLGHRVAAEEPAPSQPVPDQETSQLLVHIQARRQAIADLEQFHRRRVAELEARLGEQRALYGETHPAVVDVLRAVQTARQESPQTVALRRELAGLEAQVAKRGFRPDTPLQSTHRAMVEEVVALDPDDPLEDEEPDILFAKTRMRDTLGRYTGMIDRVDSARLELDTAQAAFKYRYSVIWPAEQPRGPIDPDPKSILLGSLVAGLVVALLATVLVDLRRRRLVARWQVEQTIGRPLLGEVRDL